MPTSGTGGDIDDGVEDLDAVAPCPPVLLAAPRARSTAVRRGPVAALAVALAVGAAAHGASGGAAAAVPDRATLLALQVSIPTGAVRSPGVPGAGGWSLYRVEVPVLNLGPDPVSVRVLGVDAPHQRTAVVPAAVEVPAGGATTVDLPLEVRCAEVPAPGPVPPGAVRGSAALAEVGLPGGRGAVRVRLPWEQRSGDDSFTQQLWSACVPRGL